MFSYIKYIFLIIAIALMYASNYLYNSSVKRALNGEETIGTVVRHEAELSEEIGRSDFFCPIIIFTSDRNVDIKFKSPHCNNRPEHSIGDKVTVIYSPLDPRQAMIKSFMPIYMPFILSLSISIIFFFVFIGFYISSRKESH